MTSPKKQAEFVCKYKKCEIPGKHVPICFITTSREEGTERGRGRGKGHS